MQRTFLGTWRNTRSLAFMGAVLFSVAPTGYEINESKSVFDYVRKNLAFEGSRP